MENIVNCDLYHIDKKSKYNEINKNELLNQIVFTGDSITDMMDLNKYYPELNAINRGINGDTTFGLNNRIVENVMVLKPRLIVLLIGTNDVGRLFSDETIIRNYDSILEQIKLCNPKCKVIMQSIYPLHNLVHKQFIDCIPRIKPLNEKIKALAEKYNYNYIDLYTELKEIDSDKINVKYSDDGLHPNDTGYRQIAVFLKPFIIEIDK